MFFLSVAGDHDDHWYRKILYFILIKCYYLAEGPLDRFVNYGFGHMRPLPGSTIYEREFRGVTLENCAMLCLAGIKLFY